VYIVLFMNEDVQMLYIHTTMNISKSPITVVLNFMAYPNLTIKHMSILSTKYTLVIKSVIWLD